MQVGEDLLDDVGALEARDGLHRPAAGRAGLDITPEEPLEALRPSHRGAGYLSVRYRRASKRRMVRIM